MSIICIGSVKGGAGKTTIATNIVAQLSHCPYKQGGGLMLVDADPQATATSWVQIRDTQKGELPSINSVQALGDSVNETAQKLVERYNTVIIDAGGHDSKEFRSALLATDRLYVPLVPSQFDLNSLAQTEWLVEQCRSFNKRLKAYIVLNRVSTHPSFSKDIDQLLPILEEYPAFELCNSSLSHRKLFMTAASEGRGVTEYDRDDKARDEMNHLVMEVLKHDQIHES